MRIGTRHTRREKKWARAHLALAAAIPAITSHANAQDHLQTPPQATVAARPSTVGVAGEGHYSLLGDDRYRSPGLAVALSLTPLPVDFGNLYAENIAWAIGYTTGELALSGAMMWLGGSHMCHDSPRCGDWSDSERDVLIGLVAGYVALKLVAGVHAGAAARSFNEAHAATWLPVVIPNQGGASAGWVARF
jgi:hypothetical protein